LNAQVQECTPSIHTFDLRFVLQDVRSQKLKKLSELKKTLCILEAELTAYGDSNPAKVVEVRRAAFLAKEAVFRWTGNHYIIHYLKEN